MISVVTAIIASAIRSSASVIYASVGESISQRSGVMNLGLEGVMLIGAVAGYITATNTNSLVLALLAALLAGFAAGLLFAFVTVTLRANQSVCGIAMVMFGTGMSGMLGKNINQIATFSYFTKIPIPGLSKIPLLGPIFFQQDAMIYILYILIPAATWFIYCTRSGMVLRALGENPAALDAMGVNVFLKRYLYVMLGSGIVALGGAYITLAYTPSWFDGITAGRGWIATAIVVFAAWNPARAAAGAILFGAIEVISLRMQSAGIPVPSYFLSMLPYIATVVVLIFSTGNFLKRKTSTPAAIGVPYDREER